VIGECSKTCGGGVQIDSREKLQEELYGGNPCEGDATRQGDCNIEECPIVYEFDETCCTNNGIPDECMGICREKTDRDVQVIMPIDRCEEHRETVRNCMKIEGAVDCVWSDWTIGECSQTCGEGKRTNTRTKVLAQFGGKECEGEGSAVEDCNLPECPDPCYGFNGYTSVCYEPEWSGLNVCMVQVTTRGTCNTYCENQGSRCVKAQDNVDGCTRDLNHIEGCNGSWNDQICVCESLTPE